MKPFKEEGFILAHSSRLGSVMVGKARQQEHKATSHIATAVKKQRDVNDDALLLLSLDFSLGPEPRGCCHPNLLWIFTPLLTKSTNSHTEGCPEIACQRDSRSCQGDTHISHWSNREQVASPPPVFPHIVDGQFQQQQEEGKRSIDFLIF